MEDRRHDRHGSLARERNSIDDLRGRQRIHRIARRSLGQTGGAAGQDDRSAGLARGRQRFGRIRRQDVVEGVRLRGEFGSVVDPGEYAGKIGGQGVEQTEELAVVEHDGDFLALADFGELRFGETGVHQHHARAELAAGSHREHQAAVIAAQHADHGTFGDTQPLQPMRQGPRLIVDLFVGQRSALVDDRRQVRIAATTLDRHGGLRSVDARVLGDLSGRFQVRQIEKAGVDQSLDRAAGLADALQLLQYLGCDVHRFSSTQRFSPR